MTRKDYVATANILAGVRESILSLGAEGDNIFGLLVADFAEMFENDNERFQAEMFKESL